MANPVTPNMYLSSRFKFVTGGALAVLLIPVFYSLWYVLAQANNAEGFIGNLSRIDAPENANGEFLESFLFTVLLAVISSTVALMAALISSALLVEHSIKNKFKKGVDGTWFEVLVSIPHAVWAAAIFLWLSQSGVLSRISFQLGLVENPADFPTLVRDNNGLGLFIHYLSKEYPFMLLVLTVVLWARYRYLSPVAASLGAGLIYRTRYLAWPILKPAALGVWLVSFSFILHSYEAPALLGSVKPRVLSVLVFELFKDPTIEKRATAALIGVLLLVVTAFASLVGLFLIWKSTRKVADV